MNKFFSLLFLLTAISFTSCSSDDSAPVNNDPGINPPSGQFTVMMNGETFTATSAFAQQQGSFINIKGLRGTAGEQISITFNGSSTGVYTAASMQYLANGQQTYFINKLPTGGYQLNGSVAITSINNNKISGTFSFTGYHFSPGAQPIVFTNGTFTDVPLNTVAPQPVGQAYVSAKIDGEPFLYQNLEIFNVMNHLVIGHTDADMAQVVNIGFSPNILPGTYPVGSNTGCYIMIGDADSAVSAEMGYITIISNGNGVLRGTFNYVGEDISGETYMVTDGEFNVPIE